MLFEGLLLGEAPELHWNISLLTPASRLLWHLPPDDNRRNLLDISGDEGWS